MLTHYLQNKVKVISHNHHHIKIKQIVHLKEIDEKNENADETEYQEKIRQQKTSACNYKSNTNINTRFLFFAYI